MRYDPPETERGSEIRAITISWSRAMWVGFWFAWGIALAWILPGIAVAAAVLALASGAG